MDHDWPLQPSEHLWNKWQPMSRSKYYRTCVHPDCFEVEYKDAPKEKMKP